VQRIGVMAGVMVLGAAVLSPAIAAFGFDPVPGDIRFHIGTTAIVIPVLYSLCASVGLALLYKVVKG
jgi:uncharacterized membrane protein (DUF441 family)